MERVLRGVRGLLGAGALALIFVASASAGWAGSDPAQNYPLGKLPPACDTSPLGKTCVNAAIYYLDRARAKLGQPAYKLPTDFPLLTPAQQMFILTNLDRIQYGLPAITGLTAQLGNDALTTGVQKAADPSPSVSTLSGWTGNWAAGYRNAPMAYNDWMFNDGLGSFNIDCTASNQSGCWGHRHDILWTFTRGSVLAMGGAAGLGPQGGRAYAMLLVGGWASYHPTYTYTWKQAVADGAGTTTYNPGVPVTTFCVVPSMINKTLSQAQSLLTKAHCALGTVTKKYAPYAKGTVIRQGLVFGTMRAVGTKIALTLSLGPTS
jgi:hypothetical protein